MAISVTVSSFQFATQTWVPSEEMLWGELPTPMVLAARVPLAYAPVEASSSVTVLAPSFATQTWVPSEEMPLGEPPTAMVWPPGSLDYAPVEASSSVTVLSK